MASSTTYPGPHGPEGETRRDFLNLLTGAFTGLGVIAVAWTMVDSMNPAADVIAAGAPLCSVSAVCAHGTQTATVRAELAARAATIASIDTTRKPGHADLLLPR